MPQLICCRYTASTFFKAWHELMLFHLTSRYYFHLQPKILYCFYLNYSACCGLSIIVGFSNVVNVILRIFKNDWKFMTFTKTIIACMAKWLFDVFHITWNSFHKSMKLKADFLPLAKIVPPKILQNSLT